MFEKMEDKMKLSWGYNNFTTGCFSSKLHAMTPLNKQPLTLYGQFQPLNLLF